MIDPRRRWARHRVDIALVLLIVAVAGPVVERLMAQQSSRMALTAALWDDHAVVIDGYPIGIDRAERDGHVYSDKAPGQPVLGIPAYAVYRAVGGGPAAQAPVEHNLGLWWVKLWTCTAPAAALAVLIRRSLGRRGATAATQAALAVALGTLLLPFASVLFGHVLSTLFAFAAWHVASREVVTNRALVGVGALLGAAVVTEYTMVLAVAALGGYCVLAFRSRSGWLALGGAPFAIALMGYQWAAFGSPLRFSYSHSGYKAEAARRGLVPPDLSFAENSFRVFFGDRGLFVATPIVAVALAGMVVAISAARGRNRGSLIAALVTAALLIGVQMSWSNPTGGDAPGPRYATAAAAFLAPGLLAAFQRWPRLTAAVGALSTLFMVAATWTDPLVSRDATDSILGWLDALVQGEWTNTIYREAFGRPGTLLLPLLAGAAALLLARACRPSTGPVSDADDPSVTPPRGARA